MKRIKKKKLKEKKIIVFSFGRSDFGILRGLVKKLKKKINLILLLQVHITLKFLVILLLKFNNKK
tara:strand:- start:8 stop:202 length:195 start_codon:yes stop_codon:yes gene_type:complete